MIFHDVQDLEQRPRWSRSGHGLLYQSGDQITTASYSVKGDTFVAEKPRVRITRLAGVAARLGSGSGIWPGWQALRGVPQTGRNRRAERLGSRHRPAELLRRAAAARARKQMTPDCL